MEILIENQQDKMVWTLELQTILVSTLEEIGRLQLVAPEAEVGITLVDNNQIQQINAQYRGIDRATDVISFALNDEADEPGLTGEAASTLQYLLGDIIISLEQAITQAEEYGHSLERELAFLGAHGMLHLLGFDHQDEDGETTMQEATEAALTRLGITR